jgi:hypothetical protein
MSISLFPDRCSYNRFISPIVNAKVFQRGSSKPQSPGLVEEIAEIYREAGRWQLGTN